MNEFEQRWKKAAEIARGGLPSLPDGAPFGFAERVVSRWQAAAEPGWAMLWQIFALRMLGTMTLALLLLLTYEGMEAHSDELSNPELESAVAEALPIP